jgi:hypothetical protein
MPRRPLVLAQSSLYTIDALHIETQTDIQMIPIATQTNIQIPDEDSINNSDTDSCSVCSESSFTSSANSNTMGDEDTSVVIYKVKSDHDQVGLFSNNFIKLS